MQGNSTSKAGWHYRHLLRPLLITLLLLQCLVAPAQGKPFYPVLFVHGIWSSARTFNTMLRHIDPSWEHVGGRLAGAVSCAISDDFNTDYISDWRPVASGSMPDKWYFAIDFSDNGDLTFIEQAKQLKRAIDCVKRITVREKIIVVAHSMGGIATRYYLQNLTFNATVWQNDIAALITIGTPHNGTAAVIAWPIAKPITNLFGFGGEAIFELLQGGIWIKQMNDGAVSNNNAHWLPPIDYMSFIGFTSTNFVGDDLVDIYSQSLKRTLPTLPYAINTYDKKFILQPACGRGPFGFLASFIIHHLCETSDAAIIDAVQSAIEESPSPRNVLATTDSYSNLTVAGVSLNGQAYIRGYPAAQLSFEYGTAGGLVHTTPPESTSIQGQQTFTQDIRSGFSPGQTIKYRARVATSDGTVAFGSIRSFMIPSTITTYLPAPTLIQPADRVNEQTERPVFQWSAVTNATSYRMLVARAAADLPSDPNVADCSSCVLNLATDGTWLQPSGGALSAGQTYFWRVHARSPDRAGGWSFIRQFTTAAAPLLPAPVIDAPANNAYGTGVTPIITWAVIAGATSYRVMIAESAAQLPSDPTDPICSTCTINVTVSDSNLPIPPNILNAPGTYVVQVKARNGAQYGAWSDQIAFNTHYFNPPAQYVLTVTNDEPGRVVSADGVIDCGAACNGSYASGNTVTLTATPNSGYRLGDWGGSCASYIGEKCQLVMDAPKNVSIQFLANNVLTVINSNPDGGTVVSDIGGIDCGATCSLSVAPGTSLTLIPKPTPGYSFAGWEGSCTGYTGNTCQVQVNADKSIGANFFPNNKLTITVNPEGRGSIISTPAGIDCGSTCSAGFAPNTSVILTAALTPGFAFHDWGGDCTGAMSNVCQVTLSAARTVTANYVPAYLLSVTNFNKAAGTITSDKGGINCGVVCSSSYASGTLVTLTATPASGYTFAGWGGDCQGTATSCTNPVAVATNVTANFVSNSAPDYPLTVVNTNKTSGTVRSDSGGIDCGETCSANYASGTTVILTAEPTAGFRFAGWGGDCYGTLGAVCTLTVAAAKSATVSFTGLQTQTYVIADIGTLGGNFSYGQAINESGTVVGWSSLSGGQGDHAFLYDDTGIHDLGAFSSRGSQAYAINDQGQIAGNGITPGDVTTHAFLYENQVMRDLGTLGDPDSNAPGIYSYSRGINAVGQIVGFSSVPGGAAYHAFLYDSTGMHDLDTLGGANSYAMGINTNGQVVGYSHIAGDTAYHAFLYDGAAMRDLGTLGGTSSTAAAINANGQIVGRSAVELDSADHPFLYDSTGMHDLGTLGGTSSNATGINTSGQIVGYSSLAGQTIQHAFLYDSTGLHDLNSLLTANPDGWTLTEARGINDSGQIAGNGINAAGANHALLLTPVQTFALTVTPDDQGSIKSNLAGIDCGLVCSAAFPVNTTITLTASPASGFSFIGWSGACSVAIGNTCQVKLNEAKNVSANFVPTYPLTITNANKAGGSIISADRRINCGPTCRHRYMSGTSVTLIATPMTGFSFSGWSRACSGMANTCQVTLNAAKIATANFTPNYLLTVTNSNKIGGAIVSDTSSIDCGSICSAIYIYPADVVLSAVPASGYTFTGWSGDCATSSPLNCKVTVNTRKTVTANFATSYIVTVTNSNKAGGTVTSADGRIDCGANCSVGYASGTSVTLTAKPAGGFSFTGWSGACVGTAASCTIAATSAKTITANFVWLRRSSWRRALLH